MIKAIRIEREALDTRSSGDHRKRVDAYFVLYHCPPDKHNQIGFMHEWVCRFEVKCGVEFKMRDFESKQEAHQNKGWML